MFDGGNPVLFILTAVFVSVMAIFGLGAMFMRAENVERNYLVGGLTVLTSLTAGVILFRLTPAAQTGGTLSALAALSLAGYVAGRVIDFALGPVPESETPDGTLGADLAD